MIGTHKHSVEALSQLPVGHWHEALGDPTVADAILDRLVHGAHRSGLRGGRRAVDGSTILGLTSAELAATIDWPT